VVIIIVIIIIIIIMSVVLVGAYARAYLPVGDFTVCVFVCMPV